HAAGPRRPDRAGGRRARGSRSPSPRPGAPDRGSPYTGEPAGASRWPSAGPPARLSSASHSFHGPSVGHGGRPPAGRIEGDPPVPVVVEARAEGDDDPGMPTRPKEGDEAV